MLRIDHRSWPVVVLVALVLMFAGTGTALAHAKLASSEPAAGSTVTTAPERVVAVFSNHDALVAEGSVLKVTDASGATVDMGDTTLDRSDPDRKTLVVSLRPGLADGVYTVSWTAVSEGDGSVAEGSFTFTVSSGEAAASEAAPAETAPAEAAESEAAPAAAPEAPANLPRTAGDEGLPIATLASGALLLGLGLVARRRARR